MDTGNAGERDLGRIAATMRTAGVTKIDHLWTTHYHGDHVGALLELAKQFPVAHFYDYGKPHLNDRIVSAQFLSAYEALASATYGLLTETVRGHSALVAAIYRELLPSGRLPAGAHGSLARLHDLTTLEEHGVEVDPELARAAVAEASEWIARLGRTDAVGSARADRDAEQARKGETQGGCA